MRKSFAGMATGAVLAASVAALIALTLPSAPAQEAAVSVRRRVEVVMVRCTPVVGRFAVTAYQGSTTAPAQRSDSCPETLSLLVGDGFEVQEVGYFDVDDDYVVYTLAR